jgi:hypothetical protein
MNKKYFIVTIASLFIPAISFAATSKKLSDIFAQLAGYLNTALALLMGFAVVAFVYFVIKYFIAPNEGGDSRTEASKYLMWSLIGFFVILSMWGIVNVLTNTFDLGSNSPGSWNDIKNLFPK